jgi:glutamate formiminotransferase
VLECVVNISEGRDRQLFTRLARSCGASLLDVHSDGHHNRSVFTLAGPQVVENTIELTREAIELIDLNDHLGAHPRIGVVDVVPFVPIGPVGYRHPIDLREALEARDQFAHAVSESLALPCFLYGPERSLPEIRRTAFRTLPPDLGPSEPHPSAGACCVGARGVLVAYNVNIAGVDLATTRTIASEVRSTELRTLGFDLGGTMQVSCNLIDPGLFGVEAAYDCIAAAVEKHHGEIHNAELVGLLPAALLEEVDRSRWKELGLNEGSTIESRLH